MNKHRTNREIEVLTLVVQVKPNRQGGEAPELEIRKVYVRAEDFPFEPLTKRELEVLYLVGMGKTNIEIAQECFIAERTVESHMQNIFDKLRAANRAHAAFLARDYHMITIYR